MARKPNSAAYDWRVGIAPTAGEWIAARAVPGAAVASGSGAAIGSLRIVGLEA